jgi:TRAP-type C4-dicarboxylate transport system permease small subunit
LTISSPPPRSTAVSKLISRLSERVALLGGVAMLAAMLVLVVTVIGGAFGRPLLGDSELVEFLVGIAVFAFLPYCQLRGSNVIVDFFSQPLPARARHWLDAVMGLVFVLVAMVLTWRMVEGGLTAWERSRRSMFLQLPDWWGYVAAILAMLLWIAVCAWTTYLSVKRAAAK